MAVTINVLNAGNMTLGSSEHSYTRFTFQDGTYEDCDINGTLDANWMINKGWMETSATGMDSPISGWSVTITDVDIGNTVTNVGDGAFYGCKSLVNATIPTSVTKIGGNAFFYANITTINIPNTVTEICTKAFSFCKSLTNITIPSSVQHMGASIFQNCTSLTNVTFIGRTLEQVQNIEDDSGNKRYPWDITNTSIITVA